MEEAVTAALTAAESFLLLLDDLDTEGAKPSGMTAKVLLAHAATHLRETLAELKRERRLDRVLVAADDELLAYVKANATRPPEWQCVLCETTYPGRRTDDGICLTCADGVPTPLAGSTVVAADEDGVTAPVTGRVVAVYPDDGTADVQWGSLEGAAAVRESLASLRPFPFRPRHLHVAQEGGASS
jgi:hypothetical protein